MLSKLLIGWFLQCDDDMDSKGAAISSSLALISKLLTNGLCWLMLYQRLLLWYFRYNSIDQATQKSDWQVLVQTLRYRTLNSYISLRASSPMEFKSRIQRSWRRGYKSCSCKRCSWKGYKTSTIFPIILKKWS